MQHGIDLWINTSKVHKDTTLLNTNKMMISILTIVIVSQLDIVKNKGNNFFGKKILYKEFEIICISFN